jgi:predicted KAP-like P-loop ATPase
MWPDNETDIDLLGFDFLIDELPVLLKEPRLLPVTIGVTGDWGSGKSSLLAMAAKALDEDKDADFIVVPFSPWKFEGYEDVKAALMQAVMRSLLKAVADDKTNAKKTKELFLRLVGRVKWFTVVRTAGAALLATQGAPPEMAALMAGGWIDTSDLEKAGDAKAADLAPASVSEFREDFEALMEGLEKVQGLVVFVDDVDRCMPETIIDTFEAIRLFLHVPKTAYVIAADQRIVQGAIEDRYPTAIEKNPSIGRDYLEKILQVTVAIPPLSTPEAETYINLLMADSIVAHCRAGGCRPECHVVASAMTTDFTCPDTSPDG